MSHCGRRRRRRHKNETTGKTIIINQLNCKGVAKRRDSLYLAEKCFVFKKKLMDVLKNSHKNFH
jgi:hypothetical protein